MKKYLMTGIAALALCVGFTSCSHDVEQLSQEEITELKAQQVVLDYQKAFVATFGQPAANHKWGFVDYSKTRTRVNSGETYPQTEAYHNMNHNEWADPTKEFGGYKVPDPLTEEQKAVVAAYFQSVPNLTYKDPELRHFFVQQVYKGGKVDAGQVRNTTEGITAANGTKYDSGNMNLLSVGRNNIHINDFNAGSCSTSNVLDNGQHVGGSSHTDQITLMVNIDDTSCFGYHETGSSTQHNNKAALVSWETIRDWANENLGAGKGDCLADDWNRSFLGFDLAIKEGEQAQSDVAAKYNDGPHGSYSYAKINNEIVSVDGNTSMNIYYLDTNTNMYVAAEKKNIGDGDFTADYSVNGQYMGKYINVDYLNQLIADGWLPVKDKNLREWVKVGKSDGYFSDWIVTLTKAERQTEWDLRIIAEDLNAQAQAGDTEDSDWDFNDVVLDVKFLGDDNVRIRVTAAGATLPIRINGEDALEVHGLYGKPTNIMINTGAAAAGYPAQAYENKYPAAATFERNISGVDASYGANIKIEVKKNIDGVDKWFELTAKAGDPAAKMGVLPDYTYCPERTDIRTMYSGFVDWVTKQNTVYWWRQ